VAWASIGTIVWPLPSARKAGERERLRLKSAAAGRAGACGREQGEELWQAVLLELARRYMRSE
jgi:hypothetical protein